MVSGSLFHSVGAATVKLLNAENLFCLDGVKFQVHLCIICI